MASIPPAFRQLKFVGWICTAFKHTGSISLAGFQSVRSASAPKNSVFGFFVYLFIHSFVFGGPVNQTQGPTSCSVIALTSNPCLALGLIVFIWDVVGLFVVFVYEFWDMSHVSLDWSKTHCVPKDDVDLFVFLPASPKCWNCMDKPLQPASALVRFVLKTELFM